MDFLDREDNVKEIIGILGAISSVTNICPSEFMFYLTAQNCPKCAKALLTGKTGVTVDFNEPVKHWNIPSLNCLALFGHPAMIRVFLEHGAPTNLRCYPGIHKYARMLPVNMALQNCCDHKFVQQWTTKKSVFNLIITLCLPEMRNNLEVVKLLASKTEGLDDEIYHYAKEGKLIELAALMLVAHKKVLSPSLLRTICSSDVPGSITLRQLITTEVTMLISERIRLEHSGDLKYPLLLTVKDRIVVLMHLLKLFEIFERVGNQLAAYLKLKGPKGSHKQVSEDVVCIMKEAGFTVKCKDQYLLTHEVKLFEDFSFLLETKNVDESSLLESMERRDLQPPQSRGNGKSPKGELKNCNKGIVDRNSIATRPYYAQWRFTYLTNHLCEVRSVLLETSETLSFLEHVSSICCESDGSQCDNDMRQLRLAIERLCCHQYLKDWSYKKSVFKLVYILFLPELQKELEHIRSFAIDFEKIEVLSCYYAKEGKIVELAALLMVAPGKFLSQFLSSRRTTRTRKCIMCAIRILMDEEASLLGKSQTNKSVRLCKQKKVLFSNELLLLNVFTLAGDAFERFQSDGYDEMCQRDKEGIAYDVIVLLKKRGFVIRDKDVALTDLSCFSGAHPELTEKQEESSKEIGMSVCSQPLNCSPVKKIGAAYRHLQNPALSFPRLPPHANNPVHSFHTFRISKGGTIFMSSSPLENQGNKALLQCHPLSPKFMPREKWASIVFAIKRGMKRI